jgi:hypothetical protein
VVRERRSIVYRQEIEQRFVSGGWELDVGFEGYLVIGYSGDNLSILAHQGAQETYDTVFELQEHGRNLTYEVQDIPTPKEAERLLEEHGLSDEEQDDQL